MSLGQSWGGAAVARIPKDCEPSESPTPHASVRRRRFLTSGTLIAAFTGVSTVSGVGTNRADAATGDAYVPVAEKGAPSGVATLDAASKIPSAQLPNLSSTYATLDANGNQPVRKGELVVNAHDHGAVGDGLTDDSAALRQTVALASASGATVLLEPGRTYLVKSALVFTDIDVRISSWGAEPAIIQAPGQGFDILTIDATLGTVTKRLAASMTLNTNGWALNDTVGVTAGMLVAVKSSKSWYYDPRPESTDARKSELHRVVAVDGRTVWTEDASNDGYDITTETVELIFVRPIHVQLQNITVKGVLPAYSAKTPAKSGISIRGAYEPTLTDVNVEQAAYLGISLKWCYQGKVLGGHTHSANAILTGYGVSTDGCAHTSVIGRTFWECRRGVDFSGGNVISRHNLVENCVQMGGGRQSDGQYYGWGPRNQVGIQNYGFGSHGPADNSTYRNNRTSNCHIPYNLRGSNEVVEGAYHVGRTRGGFINLISGAGLVARNIRVLAPSCGGAKNAVVYDGGSNINSRRADCFLQIEAGYQSAGARIFIENIDAEVQDRFISMKSGAVPQSYFHVGSVRVMFATASGTAEATVLHHEGALTAGNVRWAIGPIDYRRDGGTGPVRMTKNVDLNGVRLVDYVTSKATW